MDGSDRTRRNSKGIRQSFKQFNSSSLSLFPLSLLDSPEAYELQFFEPLDTKQLTLQQYPRPSMPYLNPFLGVSPGSSLDPMSDNFSAKEWLSNLVGFVGRDPNLSENQYRFAGVSFTGLNVYGFGSPTDYQKTVGNIWLQAGRIFRCWAGTGKQKVQILKGFDGLVENGEMLLVLGRPGSGCSTFLKTISGDTFGFVVDNNSRINYQGISAKQMHSQFRGEAIYMAETDVHFPQLTVGDTLLFAANARAPRDFTIPGVTRKMFARHMRDVITATFGLRHTTNTKVGNDFIPGVSGGERKRVSIAEATLLGSPLQCWDNSTRGLDSANALEFCRNLRLSANMAGATILVSLYQGSQETYELFDKVTVLYEGRQIYFGPCHEAKLYFSSLGFESVARQTTADFLTSLTSPSECRIRPGFEHKVPRTIEEFVAVWKQSREFARLMQGIHDYERSYPIGGNSVADFSMSRRLQQAKNQHITSPYTLSIPQQVMLCVGRGFKRLQGDATVTISSIIANSILALIVGSIFYNLEDNTSSFQSRATLIFFAILLNAFASALEIILLYDQRPIVEKHARYALYHPFTEAVSSAVVSLPEKILNCISFNLVLYFMTNLRRTPEAFFTFLLFSFFITISLSMVFRTIGASSRTLVQALVPAAIFILSLMVYTGFVIPTQNMTPWFRWINYIDPIAYAFESLMINEFDRRDFECATFIPTGPGYLDVGGSNHICAVVGAELGSSVVSGSEYLRLSFNYDRAHLWSNLLIIVAIFLIFATTYLAATEFIAAKKSKGEVLLFQRNRRNQRITRNSIHDQENMPEIQRSLEISTELPRRISATAQQQSSIFHWRDICYDIRIKKEQRRVLTNVNGWVKPGTLTALMGPSGAGKTTLLNVLATRDTVGIASGTALVDGHVRDISFQRKTGYAQQQDFHLETMTVREALCFNAILCQPKNIPKNDKLEYVEEIIKLLGMELFADAIVGVPGIGLNIEQRKKLTIGVELVSKPKLLLFLDEPTSGLDSQTSWAILGLLERLAVYGQAILCTVHQPSAMLFQKFDRLLLLAPEGKPVYFGNIGPNSSIVTEYFERNGAKPCPVDGNPADWIMEILGCVPGHQNNIDWYDVWINSPEYAQLRHELEDLELRPRIPVSEFENTQDYDEFAAAFTVQLWECFKRVNSQYWRSPSYIYSKAALSILTSLFIGFSFYKADNSMQGLENQVFSIFMLLTQAANLVPQILPNFVIQRSLYEARERPAKIYSWKVFLLANILVELPWNTLMSFFIFAAWYYPVGFYRNAEISHTVAVSSGTVFLLMWAYMMYMSTFAHMIQAGVELAGMAGNYANLLFMLTLIFCGILVKSDALPGFWTFMYRVSPYTYLVGGILSVALADAPIRCSNIELLRFDTLPGTTCNTYMKSFLESSGGYLTNPDSTLSCLFCPLDNTSALLHSLNIYYSQRWRNFGIMLAFVMVNVGATFLLYWLIRVPKKGKKQVCCPRKAKQTSSTTNLVESQAAQGIELAGLETRIKTMADEGNFVGPVKD